jgi:serine/threonine-protein kinase PknG
VVSQCNHPGCTGAIEETGYCDTCGRQLRPQGSQEPSGATDPARSSSSRGSVAGFDSELYRLPVFSFPDPSSRILTDPQVPDRVRRCISCQTEVGAGHAGQPSLTEGHCTNCGLAYSFRPSLEKDDLVAGQYHVLGCFAHGGFGWVYLAKDRNLDENLVVLKGQIDVGDSDLTRVERLTLRMADHPNIVRIFNFVTHQGARDHAPRDYIVMEYVDGLVLSEVIDQAKRGHIPLGAPLRVEHVIVCGLQILAAFDYLHGRQRLYCDMKPQNVIIRSGQGGELANRVKVIDLGAVRGIGAPAGKTIGTPPYQVRPAELEERGHTVQSDLHTVGVTLAEMYQVTADSAESLPTSSPLAVGLKSLCHVVERAMDGNPDRRFASAAMMADQLRAVYREILSARDGRTRPEPSAVFPPTARLLDDGLGSVRPLHAWLGEPKLSRRAKLPLADGRPDPPAVALGLPVPRVDPDDPAADVLSDLEALPAPVLLDTLPDEHPSAEVQFARCRADLEIGELGKAAKSLERAGERPGARPGEYWRMNWHQGLHALARESVQAAKPHFDAVYRALPGEDAPKLALAYCAEVLGDTARAEALYRAIWLRDRLQVSAAFGLARICLSRGDRAGADRELDGVPTISQHAQAAAIARIAVHSKVLACGPPSEADLEQALGRLRDARLDSEEARNRLVTAVLEAALQWTCENGRSLPVDCRAAFAGRAPAGSTRMAFGAPAGSVRKARTAPGDQPSENDLRRALERCYRSLADQARTENDHGILVDLANEIRPQTLL